MDNNEIARRLAATLDKMFGRPVPFVIVFSPEAHNHSLKVCARASRDDAIDMLETMAQDLRVKAN